MTQPTDADFRALARSSPWLWDAVSFDLVVRQLAGTTRTYAALLRRPLSVTVRDLTSPARELGGQVERLLRGADPRTVAVTRDAEGRVVSRPDDWDIDYDGLYVENYYWTAMLDPVELADGTWTDGRPLLETPRPAALAMTSLDSTERHGRETWWATVTPTSSYDPRCSCCPLLFGEVSQFWERQAGALQPPRDEPVYATSYLVGLDRATGICVSVEHLDGAYAGAGHSMTIHWATLR